MAQPGIETMLHDQGVAEGHREAEKETWRLVERFVEHYPDDWRCVFKRGDEILEVSVPEDVWRAFGG